MAGETAPKRPSYWLLGDNSTPLGGDPSRIGTFVASLKHALIFHEQILLSDSLVVNTPNLRVALQADPGLRDYLATGCLVIACRRIDERFVGLVELRENLRARSARNPGFDTNPRAFLFDGDLEHLQQFSEAVPYSPSQVGEYFTDNIRNLTKDPRFHGALLGDADIVCARIADRIKETGAIDQTFLGTRGKGTLADLVGPEVWKRVEPTVFQFQKAYYYSALPVTLGADMVFSPYQDRQRKILRHFDDAGDGGSTRIDLSRGAKSLYEAVLSSMSAAQLRLLRTSDEFKEFQHKLLKLKELTDIHDPRLEPVVGDIYAALSEYHLRIDKELFFLRYFTEGSAVLDQWNLKGILKGGEWLLRFGISALSDHKVRATVAYTAAEWLHPGAGLPFLIYYGASGKTSWEQKLDKLPERLADVESRRAIATDNLTRVDAHLEVRIPAIKDTVYTGI